MSAENIYISTQYFLTLLLVLTLTTSGESLFESFITQFQKLVSLPRTPALHIFVLFVSNVLFCDWIVDLLGGSVCVWVWGGGGG